MNTPMRILLDTSVLIDLDEVDFGTRAAEIYGTMAAVVRRAGHNRVGRKPGPSANGSADCRDGIGRFAARAHL
jgi:predicted nucleic acid-binding protein